MTTTPNYGWPLIEPTDFVTNLPADLEDLADAIDSTVKTLDDDNIKITEWVAKGDLLSASDENTPARLGVGTDGFLLSADSGETTGLKWIASTSLLPFLAAPVSGFFISGAQAFGSQTSLTNNRVYYTPVYLPAATYDRISIRTGASQSGTSSARLGLYNVGSNGRPNTVAFDAGTVSINAPETNFSITINETLDAGYYYIAVARQSATNLFAAFGGGGTPPSVRIGSGLNNNFITSFYEDSVSGAFATAGTLVADNVALGTALRFA